MLKQNIIYKGYIYIYLLRKGWAKRVYSLMKQLQYMRLFIAQVAEKDNIYNYSHLRL